MKRENHELNFKQLMESKFGPCLNGKRSYRIEFNGACRVGTSVDQSMVVSGGRTILFEIDSGNVAKSIAGQYVLLNSLYNGDRTSSIFVIVHCYRDGNNGGKLYNPERTDNHLRAVRHFSPEKNWLPWVAVSVDQMAMIVADSKDPGAFADNLWSRWHERQSSN